MSDDEHRTCYCDGREVHCHACDAEPFDEEAS